MPASALAITYNATEQDTSAEAWIRLEQQPVSSGRLTMADMNSMLALVLAGTSARAYRPPSCEAYIIGDQAHADLVAWVWPSALALPYTLEGDLVTAGPPQLLRQEREFDLVVEMSDRAELPFRMESVTATWQTPCYNRYGVEVGRPSMAIEPTAITLDAEVFGVLRLRGLALGYQHPLAFSIAKTAGASITDLKPALTATWLDTDGKETTERLELVLPACLLALLELCPDGTSARASAMQSIDPPDDLVPTVYYSSCTGRVVALRYERP